MPGVREVVDVRAAGVPLTWVQRTEVAPEVPFPLRVPAAPGSTTPSAAAATGTPAAGRVFDGATFTAMAKVPVPALDPTRRV